MRRWVKRLSMYRKQVPLRGFSWKAKNLFIEDDCLMVRRGQSTKSVLPFRNLVNVVVDIHHSMANIGGKVIKVKWY